MNYTNKCLSLLNDFIHDKLDGKIDKLKHYTFDDLFYERNTKYGFDAFPDDIWDYDPDCSKIANAIYIALWSESLPGLECTNLGVNYRGDTLNTFNTLFGRRFHKAKAIIANDDIFYRRVGYYNSFYLSIGNFSLLPNEVPDGYTKRDSMNCYRGKKWNDYYDKFLIELNLCISGHSDADKYLCELYKANNFYFSKVKVLTNFISINYLEAYLDENGSICNKRIVDFEKYDLESPNDYKHVSLNYIDRSISIIEQRADKMISTLAAKLEAWRNTH